MTVVYQPTSVFQTHTALIPALELPAPSPNGTYLSYAGPVLYDEFGNTYALTGPGYGSFTITVNGRAVTTPTNPGQVLFYNNIIYYQDTSNLWYEETSPAGPWTSAGRDPRPLVMPISLAAAHSQIISAGKFTSKILGTLPDPFSSPFTSDFGGSSTVGTGPGALSSQSAVMHHGFSSVRSTNGSQIPMRRLNVAVLKSFGQGEAYANRRVLGLLRLATDAQTSTIIKLISTIRHAIDTQVPAAAAAYIPGSQVYSRIANVISAEIVTIVKLTKKLAATASSEITAYQRVINAHRAFTAIGGQSGVATKATAVIRTATQSQLAALVVATSHIRMLMAINAEASTRKLSISIVRYFQSAQAASVAARAVHLRILMSFSSDAAAVQRLVGVIRATMNAEAAARTIAVSVIRTLQQVDVAGRTLTAEISRKASEVQAALLATGGLHVRSLFGTSPGIEAVLRTIGVNRSTTAAQLANLNRALAVVRGVVGTQLAGVSKVPSVVRATLGSQVANISKIALISRSASNAQTLNGTFSAVRAKIFSLLNVNLAACVEFYNHAGINTSKTLGNISTETAELFRIAGKVSGATSLSIATFNRMLVAARAFAVSHNEAIGIKRQTGVSHNAASSSLISLSRMLVAMRATQQGQMAAMYRSLEVILARIYAQAQAQAINKATTSVRSTIAGQSNRLLTAATRVRNLAIAQTETLAYARTIIYARSLAAVTANAAFCVDLYNHAGINSSKILAAISTEMAGMLKTPMKSLWISSGNLAYGAIKDVAIIRAAAAAQASNLIAKSGYLRRFAAAQAAALAMVRGAIYARALPSVAANLATCIEFYTHAGINTGKVISATSAEIAQLLKTPAKLLPTVSSNMAAMIRMITASRTLAAATLEAIAARRLINVMRPVLETQAYGVIKSIALIRTAVESTIARTNAMKAKLQANTSIQLGVVSLGRSIGQSFSVGAPQAIGLFKTLRRIMSSLSSQASNTLRQTMRRFFALQAASVAGSAVKGGAVHGLLLLSQSVQLARLQVPFRITQLAITVAETSAAVLYPGFLRTLSATHPMVTKLSEIYHRFLPINLRRRVVRLPPPRDITVLPATIRRIVLPDPQQAVMLPQSVRRIRLPREEDEMSDYQITHAEPPYFSPFDPTDQDSFTFDWSIRGYPNDAIVFATVVSMPAGVNFVGPAFIDGSLVEITIGPFTPSILPATYTLRCMAMFASGRISHFSVPFLVMTL